MNRRSFLARFIGGVAAVALVGFQSRPQFFPRPLEFSCVETTGVTIANVKGIVRAKFNRSAPEYSLGPDTFLGKFYRLEPKS